MVQTRLACIAVIGTIRSIGGHTSQSEAADIPRRQATFPRNQQQREQRLMQRIQRKIHRWSRLNRPLRLCVKDWRKRKRPMMSPGGESWHSCF
eukprot:symbB.v1.2.030153.t1/scaffold3362.1/size63757/6